MSLGDIVNRTPHPSTVASLVADLRQLGVRPGDSLLVHSSLSSIGWVNGGAAAVVLALQESVGRSGTLVMPTQSGDNSNPLVWCNPPVPEDWWADIAATMPAWRADLSPSSGMGCIPEVFRCQRGCGRSPHPQHSFAARGRLGSRFTRSHPLDHSFGPRSPLGKLYKAGARILMLGTAWDSCTALHLAEYLADWPGKAETREYSAIMIGFPWRRRRSWVGFDLVQTRTDDFAALGTDFEAAAAGPDSLKSNRVGLAECRLVDMRALVDFAVDWLPRHRA